ncbi:MAG: hypothetical protein V4538_15105 [Bacteroidota bacterium]
MTEPNNITDLINRYRERLKTVYTNPNPIQNNPLFEYSEIQEKIKQLERITITKGKQ